MGLHEAILTDTARPSPTGYCISLALVASYLTSIKKSDNSVIWSVDSINALGQPVQFTLGPSLTEKFGFDFYIKLTSKQINNSYQTFIYDDTLNNITERRIKKRAGAWKSETFLYDSGSRLSRSTVDSLANMHFGYDVRGNIISKSGIGEYIYNNAKVNRLDSISIDTLYQPVPDHTVTYNCENLTSAINQDPYYIQFLYGPSGDRIKTILTENGDTIKIKYYSGTYEKEITGSGTRQIHYIYSPYGLVSVMIKQGETETIYYPETDQVGSIISLLNSDGSYASSMREAASFSYPCFVHF